MSGRLYPRGKGTMVTSLPVMSVTRTVVPRKTLRHIKTGSKVVEEWPFEVTSLTTKKKKSTMLIKLRKRFLNWLRQADDYEDNENTIGEAQPEPRDNSWSNISKKRQKNTPTVRKEDSVRLDSRGVKFTVYPARGGVVIEACSYDERTDNSVVTLHVVPEGDDLDVAMANIIAVEAMRH